MFRKAAPYEAWIAFDRTAINPSDSKILERNALAVKHAEHIMIRDGQVEAEARSFYTASPIAAGTNRGVSR